jgi:cytoskeletal protein RodZ
MSLTLGEKLRKAREERGISISEVAEQTRISPHYLECIENNDYRTLPGGIFNKGFVKSYAKFVGIDEQEAVQDYTRLIAEQEGEADDTTKIYRPEVLTDDRTASSILPTIIIAIIILGLMSFLLLKLVDYLQNQSHGSASNASNALTNANTTNLNANSNINASPILPSTNEIKVEIRTSGEPIQLSYALDDSKILTNETVTADKPLLLNPKEKARINYYRSYGKIVELIVNGKKITAPSAPIPPRKNAIEYEISRENLSQILQSGEIPTTTTPGPTNANALSR